MVARTGTGATAAIAAPKFGSSSVRWPVVSGAGDLGAAGDQEPSGERGNSAADEPAQQRPGELIRVNDEFVLLGAPAVLRCRRGRQPQGGGLAAPEPEAGQLIEWFTSDGLQVGARELARGKFERPDAGRTDAHELPSH